MSVRQHMQSAIRRSGAVAVVAAALISGCATPPAKAPGPVFFPPAPEEPRIQFLTSFATANDVAPRSGLGTFVVGPAPIRPIQKPYGLCVERGRIFVCDTGARAIEILDLRKSRFEYFAPEEEGKFILPINIAVDADGTRYVADTGRSQVLVFGADGSYASAIGKVVTSRLASPSARPAGTGTNSVADEVEMKPTDVLVNTNRLYVTDLKNRSVRVYGKASHELLFTIPRGNVNDANRLFQPTNLAADSLGRIYVSDTGGFRVQQYDGEGMFLRTFGRAGDRPGEFAVPKGVAVDREGRVYVVDAKTQVIQIFDAEGRLLLFFGEPGGSRASLFLPAAIVVDYENVDLFQKYAAPGFQVEYLIIVSNQYGNRKISIYGFGHKR